MKKLLSWVRRLVRRERRKKRGPDNENYPLW